MKKNILSLAISVTFLFMTGCATILTGTQDTLTFKSIPQGAKVFIDGLEVCKTPCSFQVERSLLEKLTEIKFDGYRTRVITLDRKFNVVSILNIINPIAWAVDTASGSIIKYGKKNYSIELEEDNSTSFINSTKIDINTKTRSVDVYRIEKK